MNRREFLTGSAWMGLAAFAGGCASARFFGTEGAPMQGFRCAPMKKIRVGIVGLGARGAGPVWRLPGIPGGEVTAICDCNREKIAESQQRLANAGKAKAKEYFGKEVWRQLCDDPNVDVVYSTTPWNLHTPVALYAMEHGKHVLTEVPAAMTIDECWAQVETAERTKRHCMQLENCCYGETELLALNLCRKGVLGDLMYGEAAYVHDLSGQALSKEGDVEWWRLDWNAQHKGNQYPTHGLGPICQYMNINRGDQFKYLVSLESDQRNFEAYAKAKYGPDHWKSQLKVAMGDMNTTLVKTERGRSIRIEHDVSSPRPYTRVNTITGTRGILTDYPYRVAFEDKPGDGATHAYFDEKRAEEVKKRYMHPIWKHAGPVAATVGGHGGMDFIMDLRWAYCLQNGLPLDTDVYDLATWCSVCELSEQSVRRGSQPIACVDFTRGAWRTAPAFGIYDIDISKMPFSKEQLEAVAKGSMEV